MKQNVWLETDFLWLQPLTEKWETIRDYAVSKTPKYKPYKAAEVHNGLWSIYGLRNKTNSWSMPDPVMDQLFGLLPFQPFLAAFSCLSSGAEIYPHEGFTDDVIRFHLGLICPPDNIMKLGDIEYTWYNGKWLIFNDRITHSVWNKGSLPRYVLIMDFYRTDIGLDT